MLYSLTYRNLLKSLCLTVLVTVSGASLYAEDVDAGLRDYSEFAMPTNSAVPSGYLQGTISLADAQSHGRVVRDGIGLSKGDSWNSLPKFSYDYVRSGNDFIPVNSGIILTEHPAWDLVLSAGKIWETTSGSVMASLPFALMEKNENCLLNGVMLVQLNVETPKSSYQVASETCLYLKFDLWGEMKADWQDTDTANVQAVIATTETALKGRLPSAPLAKLYEIYPSIDQAAIKAEGRIKPSDMTLYGLVRDGVHYVSGCDTRAGAYPYCDVLTLPSYSLAKSIVGGLAMMRLEALYPGMMQSQISDYVSQCSGDKWQGVTFENLSDMATGNYNTPHSAKDEGEAGYQQLFFTQTHEEKLDFSCGYFPRKSAPGTVWAYHTSDTYILGSGLQEFWKSKQGDSADFYRDIIVPIWDELELSQVVHDTRRTTGARAQAFTGWGLVFHRSDIAKIASYINSQAVASGKFSGPALNGALQRNPNDRGIKAEQNNKAGYLYNNGFWAKDVLICGEMKSIPFMSGFGGISIALSLNGDIYYSFSDGGSHAWADAVATLATHSTNCKKVSDTGRSVQ